MSPTLWRSHRFDSAESLRIVDGLALLQRVAPHAPHQLARLAAEHGAEDDLDPENKGVNMSGRGQKGGDGAITGKNNGMHGGR